MHLDMHLIHIIFGWEVLRTWLAWATRCQDAAVGYNRMRGLLIQEWSQLTVGWFALLRRVDRCWIIPPPRCVMLHMQASLSFTPTSHPRGVVGVLPEQLKSGWCNSCASWASLGTAAHGRKLFVSLMLSSVNEDCGTRTSRL